MVQYLSRLLRAAIVSILGVGGGIALFFFIFIIVIRGESDFLIALKGGLTLGIAFSMILLAVMVLLDLTARLFIARGISNNFWDLEQKREIVLPGTVKQVLAACRQALLVVPNVTSVLDDAENLSALAFTGSSWRSYGEEIKVEIKPLSDNKCQVICTSSPKSSKVVFDYGKNFENVETWLKKMVEELKPVEKTS